MKYLVFLMALLLAGCHTIPPQYPKWPDAPSVGNCPELDQAANSEKLSELLSTVTKNYGKYHECAARVDAWQQWHKEQKKIYEDAIK